MSTALKAINKRVKVLQKKHPKSKRTSLQKQAGREWKAGKLKAKRKTAAPKKRRVVRKKVARKKVARKKVSPKRPSARKRRRVGAVKILERGENRRTRPKRVYKIARRKNGTIRRVTRVGGIGGGLKAMLPVLVIGGLGLLAYSLLHKSAAPVYVPTGNVVRDNKAQEIIQTATSAGLAAAAIAKLIQQLQAQSNTQLDQTYDNVVQSGDVPEYLYS